MTSLTPDEDAQLGKWCPQHSFDPTDPPIPFYIAHELTDPIFETSHLKGVGDHTCPVAFHAEIQDSPPDPQSIVNSVAVEMSLPLDFQGAYAALYHIIAN